MLGIWQGLIFLNISNNAAPLFELLDDMPRYFERFDLAGLRRAQLIEYDVRANWKAIIENYSECYHCPGVHPQLNKITPFNLGDWIRDRGPWRASWMPVVGDYDTLTMDGQMTEHGRDLLRWHDRGRSQEDLLLRRLAESADQPASRLSDDAPDRAARARSDLYRLRVLLRSRADGPTGVRPVRRHRVLGSDQPAGLGGLRAAASRALPPAPIRPVASPVWKAACYAFDVKVADRYANDGVLTPIVEVSKADATTRLAGRIKSRAVAD